jgi:hypothetical protein
MTFGNGSWKEGRTGAASLCYVGLATTTLEWVAAHHARVGIRATVVARGDEPLLAALADRNWDLALGSDASVEDALAALDQRRARGVVLTAVMPTTAPYAVTSRPGSVAQPLHGAATDLPSHKADTDADAAQMEIDAVATAGAWAVWRIDDTILAGWGVDGHRRLLGWLGSQHGRIWCAPVRDIAAW